MIIDAVHKNIKAQSILTIVNYNFLSTMLIQYNFLY